MSVFKKEYGYYAGLVFGDDLILNEDGHQVYSNIRIRKITKIDENIVGYVYLIEDEEGDYCVLEYDNKSGFFLIDEFDHPINIMLSSMRMLKAGNIFLKGSYKYSEYAQKYERVKYETIKISGSSYFINYDDLLKISEIFKKLSYISYIDINWFTTACLWFNKSYIALDVNDKLLYLWMALESLYLGGLEEESKYRYKKRTLRISKGKFIQETCSLITSNNDEDYAAIKDMLKDMYNLRNKSVHPSYITNKELLPFFLSL